MPETYSENEPDIQPKRDIYRGKLEGLSDKNKIINSTTPNQLTKDASVLPEQGPYEPLSELNDINSTFLPFKTKKPKIAFWMENPNVLFQSNHILEFFPVETMTYSQKLNAITRTVLIMAITIFAITHNPLIFIIFAITIASIALVYHNHSKNINSDNKLKKNVRFDIDDEPNTEVEPFIDKSDKLAQDTLALEQIKLKDNKYTELFDKSTPSNPFSNVLLTDYENNPTKKNAPTSYNKYINADILGQAKEFVKQANPDQPDIADKLFKDLGEEFQFEQSMRPFYSNAATTIPNDQQAFADFCYGGMISCKEGNMFACSRKYQTRPTI